MPQNNSPAGKRRKGPGRPFPPGVSGNPGGRPKGFGARIRELTKDGEDLITIALKVARGQYSVMTPFGADAVMVEVKPSAKEVMDAVKWLALYGIGSPPKVEAVDDEVSAMTDEELKAALRPLVLDAGNAPSTPVTQ